MSHLGVVGRAMPVLDPGRRPDDITRGDALFVPAPLLDPPAAGRDDQRLTAGVGVPCRACARREGHLGRTESPDIVDVEQWCDTDLAGERVGGPTPGLT